MDKIKLVANSDLGILTFQNLSSEYYAGMPDNWIRCFICRDESETVPDYNRILFLRNVNIRPMIDQTEVSPLLPVWHAAVVLLEDEEPRRLMLVKESNMLDRLVSEIPFLGLIKHDFPDTDVSRIRVDLDDANELPKNATDKMLSDVPISVLRGWPAESSRQQYLRTQEVMNQIAQASGRTATTDFTYEVETKHLAMSLHFIYCMVTQRLDQAYFISDDILCAKEAW